MNQKVSKTAHIKELNQEIDRLKAELFCTREKNGVYMPAELFQQREQVCRALLQRSVFTLLPSVRALLQYKQAPPEKLRTTFITSIKDSSKVGLCADDACAVYV